MKRIAKLVWESCEVRELRDVNIRVWRARTPFRTAFFIRRKAKMAGYIWRHSPDDGPRTVCSEACTSGRWARPNEPARRCSPR